MRIYLPLILSDLEAPTISTANAVKLPASAQGTSAEELEVMEDEALMDAAFSSLELSADSDVPAARVVAVADVKGPLLDRLEWGHVESIMADTLEGRRLARRALDATAQDEADALVDELFDEPMSWFDVTERQKLAETLRAST